MTLGPASAGSVRLQDVVRSFAERTVVHGLSLEAATGSIIGLEGANGTGKTTALRLMAGTLSPDSGIIEICDAPAGRGGSAFVPAGDRGLYWRMTVRDNLRFFARLGHSRARWGEAVDAAAEEFGLAPLMDRRVEACSTGQRRRIMIARAAVAASPVLLIDEPYEGLDEEGVATVARLSSRWAADGGVVVWAAPDGDHGPAPTSVVRMDAG